MTPPQSPGMTKAAKVRDLLEGGLDEVSAAYRQKWGMAGASFDLPVILHGTGQLGQAALRLFRTATGTSPVAFTDNNAENWGTTVDGVPVLSVDAAVDTWRTTGVFVAALYNPASVLTQLRATGASVVVPWTWMFAADPDHFLPYWGIDAPDRVFTDPEPALRAIDVWADEASRDIYLDQLLWMMTLDSDGLGPNGNVDDAYFDETLVRLSDHERFVDCGAYDGDSFAVFRQRTSGAFASAHLIEPDPQNFEDLSRWLDHLPAEDQARISLHNFALGGAAGTTRFTGTGTVDAAIDASGEIEVKVQKLDALVHPTDATFVKVDVEGGEMDLLSGATGLLEEGQSTWTIMAYHRPHHLWEIPLELSRYGGRTLHLRRYAQDCWERCVYAIPEKV